MGMNGNKPEQWGLSGGRMDFPNNPSITVKNLTLNPDGELLLVAERSTETKNKTIPEGKTYEEALKEVLLDMERLIALLQGKGYPMDWDAVNRILDSAIPKSRGLFKDLLKIFTAEEIGDRKINPNFVLDWDPDSETMKVVLTSMREELEETGLLVKPTPLAEFRKGDGHKVVICHTVPVSKKIRKESQEIREIKWWPLDQLPPTRSEASMETELRNTMYDSHKFQFLPKALTVLRMGKFSLSDAAKQQIDAFLLRYPIQTAKSSS